MLLFCAAAVWGGVVVSGWAAHLVRETIVTRLSRSTGRAVALGGVSGNLLTGLELRDLVIAERGGFSRGVAFSVERARLSMSLWDLARRPHDVLASIDRAELTTPHVELVRDARGRWNVADLLTQQQAPLGPAFHGQVVVHGGVIMYADSWGVEAPPFVTRFEKVDGTIAAEGGRVLIALAGRSTAGEAATVHGRYGAGDGTYDLDITAKDASVPHWGGYLVRLGALRWDGGRFTGRVHLLATASRARVTMDYTAAIRLDDAEALYRPAGIPLRHARGDLELTAGHVAAPNGLTLVADNSPVWIRGDVSYAGQPWLDLVVRGEGLDLAKTRALLPVGPGATLTGRASGDVWISGPLSAPAVSGAVATADGRFNGQDFTDLAARFDYDAGVLSVRRLSAGLGDGRVSGDAVIDLTAPEPFYTFAGSAENLDTAVLPRAGLPIAGVTGRGSGTVAGVGVGARLQVLGAVSLDRGTAHGQAFDQMAALFWDDGQSVVLDAVRLGSGGGSVYASGSVAPGGALDLSAEGHQVPLAELAVRTGLAPSNLSGVGRFDGHIGGTLADPALSGAVAAWDGRLGPLPYTFAAGTLRITPQSVSTTRSDFFDGGAHYGVSGALALRPLSARNVALVADGVPAQSFLHETAGVDSVTGTLAGHLVVNGSVGHPSVAGHATLTRGSVMGQTVDAADLDLEAGPAAGVIRVARLDAHANGSHVHASGTVDTQGPLNLNFQADRVRPADISALSRLGVVPYGTVTVDGRVTGTLGDPEFNGRLMSPDLWMQGQAFSASGIVDYRSGQIQLAPLDLVQGDASYSLSGSVSWTGPPAADLNLHVTHGQIATLADAAGLRLPAKVQGVIDGDVALSGPLSDPSARLTLALTNARIGGIAAGTGDADLVLSHGAIDIRQFDLHPGRGEVDARGQVRLGGASAVEVSARDLDPGILVPVFHLRQPLVGSLAFTMQWMGTPANATAGLSLEAIDAGVPGVTVDKITALAYYKNGTITIQNGMIVKDAHTLALEGTLPVAPGRFDLDPNGPLQLSLHLEDADLSFLSLLTPAIQNASGTVAGHVAIGGTVAQPTMTGSVQTSGGRLRYAPLRTPIENIAADIAFSRDEVNVHNVSADVGGGHVVVQGTAAISDFRPETLDLKLAAKQTTIDVPGLYTGRMDASLALHGPAADPTLSGAVTLSNGRVTYAGPLTESPAAPEARRPLPPVALDVNIGTNGNLSYGEGPVLLALAGAVHAGGTLADPKLSGDIRSDGGTVNLFGTPFTVVEGRATFSESLGFTPMVTARAQGQVGDYRIFVDVSGLLPNPSVVWSSEPPLTQSDILAVVFGATGEVGTPTGLAGIQLGRILIGSVTSAIQRALHLDELTLSYDTQNPITLRIGKFITANFYLSLTQVFPQQTGTGTGASGGTASGGSASGSALSGPVLSGIFGRPVPAGQSYTVLGVNYLVSSNLSISYDVDTLGNNGIFMLTRFPF